MHVILDRQHYGKPGKTDLGVAVDRDGDGKKETVEANLTPVYIAVARAELERLGHTVSVLDAGWYPDRHKAAVALAKSASPCPYVACHLNAGGGRYGLVAHDHRSSGGRELATHVAHELYAEIRGDGVTAVHVRAASSDPPWTNAYYTIKGIYDGPGWLSGICFEPVFVDQHRSLLSDAGLGRIGTALARGILAWKDARFGGEEGVEESLWQDGVELSQEARDPRADPRPGDTVAPGPGRSLREVLDRDDDRVVWREWPFGATERRSSLGRWRHECSRGVPVEVARRPM